MPNKKNIGENVMITKTNGKREKITDKKEQTDTTKKHGRGWNAKGNPNLSNKGESYQNRITKQQILFCHEFVRTNFNQTQAALAANYSKKSAPQIANRLLKQEKIQNKINEIMQKKMSEMDVTITDVIQELKLLAFSDIKNILSWDKKQINVIPSDKLKEFSRCIKTITFVEKDVPFEICKGKKTDTTVRRVRIELHDKLKALELIGRNLKMFTDKVEMSGDINCIVIDGDDDGGENNDSTGGGDNKKLVRNVHPKFQNLSKYMQKKRDEQQKDKDAS